MVDKSHNAYKTIGEVSKELNIPTHVLRFWETKFNKIKPLKRKNGHRYYTLESISTISHIKNLLQNQGLTIKGVQRVLKGKKEDLDMSHENSNSYLVKKELSEMKNLLNEVIRDLKSADK